MKKHILLMYISKNSGHYHASHAIEKAFHELSDDVETLNVDSFCYTNPILEKIVNKAYMEIIKKKPEVWGYLYDNPRVVEKTQRLRDSIHKYNSHKTKNLLDRFKPHAVICTQAFPCGIIADYKKTHGSSLLLAGVLTDYAPHSYWVYDSVDVYFVPSEETREKLISNGVSPDKFKLTGIPIESKFKKIIAKDKIIDSLNLSPREPVVLVMGGSQGFGPIREIMNILNNLAIKFQIVVVAGGNKKLYRYLKKHTLRFSKKTIVYGYTENIDELMGISSLIISKPGGITISEAAAKGLAVLIIKPIPGHEQMNTDHLVENKIAIKIDNLQDVGVFVKELLSNPSALKNMQERAKAFSRPNSAHDIAQTVLEKVM
ncbi:MAG: glycosyltransferase [Candidatus Omnitrophica bacterium]|nr:glycosyltransferase [Candidatus Omnitrophota bacterium]